MSSRRSLASFALSRPTWELVALFFWVRPVWCACVLCWQWHKQKQEQQLKQQDQEQH